MGVEVEGVKALQTAPVALAAAVHSLAALAAMAQLLVLVQGQATTHTAV